MPSIKLIPCFFKVVLLDIQFSVVSVSPRKLVRENVADQRYFQSLGSGFRSYQRVNYLSVPVSTR